MSATSSLPSLCHNADSWIQGTRVHIYRWLDNIRARKEGNAKELQSLPILKTKKKWTKKIHPGLSN